jgi:hypothetical protein
VLNDATTLKNFWQFFKIIFNKDAKTIQHHSKNCAGKTGYPSVKKKKKKKKCDVVPYIPCRKITYYVEKLILSKSKT